jgi:hypothetical protein
MSGNPSKRVRAVIEALAIAALNVLDEELSPKQRRIADAIYDLATELEDTLEDTE